MQQPSDPKARAAAKVAARRLRLATIRRRATMFAASVLSVCCLVIGGQLVAGRDPALSQKTTQAPAKATNTKAEGTDSEADYEPTEAEDDSGATPATVPATPATPEPTPVTTSQS